MKNHKKETWKKNKNTKTDTKPDDTDGKTVVVSDCLNIEQGLNAYRRQWKHSVISKWLAIREDRYFPPPHYSIQVLEKEVRSEMWNVAGQTWESGFALAGNGYLRSWKWSGPFWHFHSPAGMSNLQCKTERLEKREGEMERETQSVRWGRNQGNRLHGRVKKWLETEFGRTVQAREINMDRKYLEVMEKCERRAQILTSRK